MARLMVVLKPKGTTSGEELIPRLLPTLALLDTEIDHQGKLHLSGLLRVPPRDWPCSCLPMCSPRPMARNSMWC